MLRGERHRISALRKPAKQKSRLKWKSKRRAFLRALPVEPQRVAAQRAFLVGLREIVTFEQLVDLMTALGGVEDFVREVAAEEKRFSPAFLDRSAESVVVTIEADKDSPFTQLFFEVIACLFTLFRTAEKVPL